MIVKLRNVSGQDLEVEVDADTDIETLKAIIISTHSELGEDPDAMRLVYKGQIFKDPSATVGSYGFKDGDIMHMSMVQQPAAAAAAAAPAPVQAPDHPSAVGGVLGPPSEDLVAMLMGMGFPRESVVAALRAAFNDGERAIEYLLSGNIPPPPEDAGPPPAAAPGMGAGGGGGGGSWPEAVLGPQLMTRNGMQPTSQALGSPSVVLVYFSAHWCPPCRGFTPQLARAYSSLGEGQSHVRVVFASGDRSPQEFQTYFGEMPWLALPFGVPQIQMLNMQFGVKGIPSVVALDGRTGNLLDASARGTIQNAGFDLLACARNWGANVPAGTPKEELTVLQAAAASGSSGVVWPKVEKIDGAVARAAIQRAEALEDSKQAAFRDTLLKLLENILNNPQEVKFRTIKKTNKALSEKVFSDPEGAAVELLKQAGFQDEAELVSLPGPPDGRMHAVWELLARSARDAKLAKVLEEEKKRPEARTYGGDENGRTAVGRKPTRGGGG